MYYQNEQHCEPVTAVELSELKAIAGEDWGPSASIRIEFFIASNEPTDLKYASVGSSKELDEGSWEATTPVFCK